MKKLEEKGYLRRERSTKDERVVIASITDDGVKLRAQAVKVPAAISQFARGFFGNGVRSIISFVISSDGYSGPR
ncbi:MAG: winged helix DNA-binding protein [Selenomonas sp.]|nr:winged helix DNA-binding protein [Selenomonas sp.]